MRILVLSDSFPPHNLGGAGEVAHLVSTRLAARGHDVLVVTTTTRRRDAGRERLENLSVHRLWAPVPAALRLHLGVVNPVVAARVGRLAARFRPDVVHAHNVHERLSFLSLRAAAAAAPVLLTVHDYLLFCLTKFLCSEGNVDYTADPRACTHCRHIRRAPGRNRAVHSLVRRSVAAVACISQAQRTALLRNGFADLPLEVVYNGIEPPLAPDDAAAGRAFRQRYGLDARPLVLFGGRISGAKGGDQLLRAMVEARRRLDCQLAILGDRQEYFAHARRLADQVGLAGDALHPIGWLGASELEQAFAAADVCATPSVYPDPFNLMNLRAMAHRKPVVGTCHGATPEIVVDGETGFIADPWDPPAFGGRIADVLLDPALGERLGAAGRRRLEREFTLGRQVDAYLALFDRLRTSRHPHGQPHEPYAATGAPA